MSGCPGTMRASVFFVLRAAITTSWAFLPTPCAGVTESDSPCTESFHFLKLRGDLVASVNARLAALDGSLLLRSLFTGGCAVSISAVSATGFGADGVRAWACAVSSGVASGGETRIDV